MGIELAKCYVVARGDISKVAGDLEAGRSAVEEAGNSLAMSLSGPLVGAMAKISALFGVGMLARWGASNAMAAEQTAIAFEVMLGSMEETKRTMGALSEFAASTPFEMPEIEQAASGLIMFGERGEELMETLEILGNAAAGTSTPFGMISLIFNQVRGVGKLLTQDFRQLSSRGVLSLQDIAKHFGVTTGAAQKMLSTGQVGFKDLRDILKGLSSEGGKFANMTEKQSKSLQGLISTLKDDFGIFLRNIVEIGLPILKGMVNVLIQVSSTLRENVKWVVRMVAMFVAAKVAIMLLNWVTQIYALRLQMAAGWASYLAVLAGPAGWAKIASAIAAAGVALVGVNLLMAKTTDEISSVKEGMDSFADTELGGLKSELDEVRDSLDKTKKLTPINLVPYGVPRRGIPKMGYETTGELNLEEGGFGVEAVMRLHRQLEEVRKQGEEVAKALRKAVRDNEPELEGKLRKQLDDLDFRVHDFHRMFRAFGSEVILAERVEEFRERLSKLNVPAGLEEIIRELNSLVAVGELSTEKAKAIYKTYYDESPFGKIAEEIADVNFEVEALAGGWDQARIELEKFARQKWVSEENRTAMEKAMAARERLHRRATEEERLEDMAKEAREKIQTPAEKMQDFVADVEEMVERFRQGIKGGLSPEEATRFLQIEREKIKEGIPKSEVTAVGRFGFAEYGKHLQDLFLKSDDPAKKTAENTAAAKVSLASINQGIQNLQGKMFYGMANYAP